MPGPIATVRLRLIALSAGCLTKLSGRSVGITGSKGAFFHLVRAALRLGTADDFRRWISSRRPQVRALGLVCLCLRPPTDLEAAVAPLLNDPAKLKVRPFGNMVVEQTLAQLAKRLLNDPSYFGHRSQVGK